MVLLGQLARALLENFAAAIADGADLIAPARDNLGTLAAVDAMAPAEETLLTPATLGAARCVTTAPPARTPATAAAVRMRVGR